MLTLRSRAEDTHHRGIGYRFNRAELLYKASATQVTVCTPPDLVLCPV